MTTPMNPDEPRLLPKPPRHRDTFHVPVPMYGHSTRLLLPCDMTLAEAEKIARVVLAYAGVTAFNVRSLS